ncbi:unnamed protein product [Leptosia nina]|uniref:Uncharacterized protein n=1 Tax=Leptosia nina TaxID=320188 RepID=A0AAV1JW99_9NEOP
MYVVAAMAPYLRSTVDGVLPVRRLASLHLAHTIAKQARNSRGAAARATSHHRARQRATCACVLDGSTERTGARRSRRARAGAERGGPAHRPPAPRHPLSPPPANDAVIAPRPGPAPRYALAPRTHRHLIIYKHYHYLCANCDAISAAPAALLSCCLAAASVES